MCGSHTFKFVNIYI